MLGVLYVYIACTPLSGVNASVKVIDSVVPVKLNSQLDNQGQN